jgi:small subunit ribosomal protein S13
MAGEFRYFVRIANTDIDGNKQIGVALRKIKGIGFSYANAICNVIGIDKNKKTGDLTEEETKRIEEGIRNPQKYNLPIWMFNRRRDSENNSDKHLLLSDLDFTTDMDIKKMKIIRCYKGVRHTFGLPVRGQRTKSNFRRNKGKVLGVKRGKAKAGRV